MAIEDKRFYEHKGVDWYRTVGAIFSSFLGSSSFGGSTITQQLIKNLTGDNEVTVQRKLVEIFRALEFEKKYDKEEELKQQQEAEKVQEEATNKLALTIEENERLTQEENAEPLSVDQETIKKNIEEARNFYFEASKKQRRINTIVTIAVMVVLVAALVLMIALSSTVQWITYVSISIMIVALICVFIFQRFAKNKLGAKAEDYIAKLYNEIDTYLYTKEGFSELSFKPQGQLKDEIFFDARFYKDLKSTRSRNLVSVKYKGKLLVAADLAGNILIKNRLSPMFLGKFYDYENSYDKEGKRIIMQIKGGELSRPIDDVEDLKLVDGNDTYAIYSNDEEWRKVLKQDVIKDICKLKIDKTLIDVIISIRPGKTSVGIDYVDEFMNIPVEHEFDFNQVRRTEKDLEKVLKIFDDIE